MVWPDPISLATTLGISLPVGTEMFHFPTFPPRTLCVQMRVTGHDPGWVSPFGNPRIKVRLPTPRGLSQATTSFFGSWCQGIHRMLLKTCTTKIKDARVHCAVLKLRAVPHPHPTQPCRKAHGPNEETSSRPFPQDPTVCQPTPQPDHPPVPTHHPTEQQAVLTRAAQPTGPFHRCSTREHHLGTSVRAVVPEPSPSNHHEGRSNQGRPVLLRKEVIQPHLPVRLPCYDFVPIANPTFDGSPHKGWATGFGCYRLS